MKIEIFTHPSLANTYIVSNNDKAIVIDPNNGDMINKYLSNHNLNLISIILTHGHYDHFAGLKVVAKANKSATIMMEESEYSFLEDSKKSCARFFDVPLSEQTIYVDNPKYFLEDEDEINILDTTMKIIHTPFHTSGSICLYFPKENVLFTGDTLFHLSVGRSDLPTGNIRLMKNSLDKLKKLPLSTIIYPGHERKTTLENEIKFNSYLK